MSDTPTQPTATPAPAADSLWRQGAGVGAAVGIPVSLALGVGLNAYGYYPYGINVFLTQAVGVAAGVAFGALVGGVIGSRVTVSEPGH